MTNMCRYSAVYNIRCRAGMFSRVIIIIMIHASCCDAGIYKHDILLAAHDVMPAAG